MKYQWNGAGQFLTALALGSVFTSAAVAADIGTGSVSYKGRTIGLKYAWLVSGPSDTQPRKTVRRLVMSASDIGAKLKACATFSCTDGSVTEGMTVDFTGGPRLNYWIVMNGQKVQYSGTAAPDAFAAAANEPVHLAGRLAIDDTSAGGPKIDLSSTSRCSRNSTLHADRRA